MLPKPEKKQKLNNNLLSDSEITKESDEVIAAKRIKTKRRLILISLIFTAGLSLIFWTVRGVKSFLDSPEPKFDFHFNFKLPDLKFKSNKQVVNKSTDNNLNQFLSGKNWSVIIIKNNDLPKPVYQFNSDQFTGQIDSLISDLNKIKATENSNILTNLPQGLLFQEKIDTISKPYFYGNIITLPGSHLTFMIYNQNQSQNFSKEISEFINLAYWYTISQN
jgi:hypothetical protein